MDGGCSGCSNRLLLLLLLLLSQSCLLLLLEKLSLLRAVGITRLRHRRDTKAGLRLRDDGPGREPRQDINPCAKKRSNYENEGAHPDAMRRLFWFMRACRCKGCMLGGAISP
jgi:hypothetical protein